MDALLTCGYTVIKNWLNSSELSLCLENLSLARAWRDANGSSNGNYPVMSDQRPHPLFNKITSLLADVRASTGLLTDIVIPKAIYFDTEVFAIPWHQDHEPYFQYWDNYNALTCWTPLVKPLANQSGLSVVPMDLLEERVGTAMFNERFLGRGGKLFTAEGGRTRVKDDLRGDVFWLDFDIADISHTPDIEPGDLLLFRDDVIHRSQAGPARSSMAVRCYNSQAWVEREWLYNTSPAHKLMMIKNPGAYERLHKAFADPNVLRVQIKDI